jgi:hypothetical protein
MDIKTQFKISAVDSDFNPGTKKILITEIL